MKKRFYTYHENNNGTHIPLGDNRSHEIKGYGDVCVTLPNGHVRQVQNVMPVLGINKNIILVFTIAYKNIKVEFFKSHCIMKDIHNNYNIIVIVGVEGFYKLFVNTKYHQAVEYTTMKT